MRKLIFAALAGAAFLATPASAAVDVDLESGTGFVGKGDVQLVYGWNNKGLQDNANNVEFRIASVSETSWECYNAGNDKTQERSRTTSLQGVFSSIARERNQFTGFILNGYDGSVEEEVEGNPLGSCPSGPWAYVEGSEETVELGGGGLEVSVNGTDWFPLQ